MKFFHDLSLGLCLVCWFISFRDFFIWENVYVVSIVSITHAALFFNTRSFNDNHRENLHFTHISTIMAAWLLLTFFICLHNQLSSIHSIITYSRESSLIRNTSARHEQHKSNTNKTSETRATRVRHECYANNTSATRVKNFDFDSDTSKNILLNPYIYCMATERLQGQEKFYELPFENTSFICVNAFKKCTTKTKLFNGKSYIAITYKLYGKVVH